MTLTAMTTAAAARSRLTHDNTATYEGLPPYDRDAQSIAFFIVPQTLYVHSSVTNKMPSARSMAARNATTGSGSAASRSWLNSGSSRMESASKSTPCLAEMDCTKRRMPALTLAVRREPAQAARHAQMQTHRTHTDAHRRTQTLTDTLSQT
jgi:hypothetical protein